MTQRVGRKIGSYWGITIRCQQPSTIVKRESMFFGETRGAFLEFLRNLTPQIVLLTASLILGYEIDFTSPSITWSGLGNVFPFAICVLMLVAAFIANVTQFIDKAISSNESLNIEIQRIRASDARGILRIRRLLGAAWIHKPRLFLEITIALLVAQGAFGVISLMALQGTLAALRAMR